ncbi:MAG: RtcB family protein [Myxococcota bacterium]|nr:RtcB family protein [Myxococcota bacterium]
MAGNYQVIRTETGVVKAWVNGVTMEDAALTQLTNLASLPFIHGWVAAMPDVHLGKGATIGSVVPTHQAIIPAAVGVDIGCGMMAVETTMQASDLPDSLRGIRFGIEAAVPHGRTSGRPANDVGSWSEPPAAQAAAWGQRLAHGFNQIVDKHPLIARSNHVHHLGTLGTGNHFIEVCLDERDRVWVMLHTGSRGVGARIGMYFIELAKDEMRLLGIDLPDQDLAYLSEGSLHFGDYVMAVEWAQAFAHENRRLMMDQVLAALRARPDLPDFGLGQLAVNCHHNYVSREHHFGEDIFVTRKGAVSARAGQLGIIPGSMGTRSFIVRGKGHPESFCSCSHGAGRAMSRRAAKRRFSRQDHIDATAGVECRKDTGVIDETPLAYKDIDAVMAAQDDLVEIVHTLRQVVCIKG